MTKKEYKSFIRKSGEPKLLPLNHYMWKICCDCGLAHLVVFEVSENKDIIEYVYRDDWETQEVRKVMDEESIKETIKVLQKELKRRKK